MLKPSFCQIFRTWLLLGLPLAIFIQFAGWNQSIFGQLELWLVVFPILSLLILEPLHTLKWLVALGRIVTGFRIRP